MRWNEKYDVKFHETDANEIVSVSQTFKYIQETAMRQMKGIDQSYESLFEHKKAFILSAIRLEMYSPIYAYEKIDAYTWASEGRGFTYPRYYEIQRNGEVVCRATSNWALVDTETKKLLPMGSIDTSKYPMDEPVKTEHTARIRIPAALPLALVGEYTVRYSDIDLNGHMNNTNYANFLCDYIPNIEKIRITSIGISFLNEAKYKDTLKVYLARVDSKYYVRTVRSDGNVNVEAEIVFESLE
ncbi:MAG: hypothetical protein J6B60_00685 [Clostridia bacterium]|nr:hypothetical protein [Clostridia bacterium]